MLINSMMQTRRSGSGLQNKSSANWTIYASAYSINGIMTNNNMFDLDCEIAKGKKANAKLELDTDFMEDMGERHRICGYQISSSRF